MRSIMRRLETSRQMLYVSRMLEPDAQDDDDDDDLPDCLMMKGLRAGEPTQLPTIHI